MPQPKKGPRLGSNPSHQKLMLANLAGSLFEHERIRTTEAKAKALRPFAEKLITKAKKGDVHNRRQVLSVIEDRDVVHKLFDDIGPRFSDRNGGYTRILKIGPRAGDGAPMVMIELVAEGAAPVATTVETPEGKKRRLTRPGGRRRRDVATEPEGEAVLDEEEEALVEDEDEDVEPEVAVAAEIAEAEVEEPGETGEVAPAEPSAEADAPEEIEEVAPAEPDTEEETK